MNFKRSLRRQAKVIVHTKLPPSDADRPRVAPTACVLDRCHTVTP
jgi:hypothetical protein